MRELEDRKDAESVHYVPCQSSSSGIFLNHCMWSSAAHQQIWSINTPYLENHEVRKVQTIIKTVQAQMNNLIYGDSQIFGLNLVPEWFDGSWRNIPRISELVELLMNTEVFIS